MDDDEAIVDALSLVLIEEGYEVVAVPKAEKAVAQAKQFLPQVVLLDLLMSGYDGRDICKLLKQDETTKRIPIIMISAHPAAQKEALEAGANDFLAKPFEVADLLAKVREWTNSPLE